MKNTITGTGIALLIFAAGIFTKAMAQEPIKVLFIGNSYTYYGGDLAVRFEGLAFEAGQDVTTDEVANPGQYFDGPGGHSTSSVTYAKIRSQAWDYVVLQDNQGYFGGYVNGMSAAVIAANMRVRDSVRVNHPCARVIWFSGWTFLGGYPSGIPGDNTIKSNDRIDTNYQIMNNKYPAKKELIAPFGRTWNNAIKAQPSIESTLFNSDGSHPSATGQLANAAALYTMIFKQDPSNVNYVPSGVTAANAALVRNKAYITVMTPYIYNSHNMPDITPVVTNNGGVLTAAPAGYSGYQWYLNNVAIPGATSASYTPTTTGSYMVIAKTASTNCPQNWSFPVAVTVTGIEETETNNHVVLYPNPVTKESVIELKDINWEGSSIEIINMVGQVMHSQPLTSDVYYVSNNDFKTGMYFYTITDREGNKYIGKINVM